MAACGRSVNTGQLGGGGGRLWAVWLGQGFTVVEQQLGRLEEGECTHVGLINGAGLGQTVAQT